MNSLQKELDEILAYFKTLSDNPPQKAYTYDQLVAFIQHKTTLKSISFQELMAILDRLRQDGNLSPIGLLNGVEQYVISHKGKELLANGGYVKLKEKEKEIEQINVNTKKFNYQTRRWSFGLTGFSVLISFIALVFSHSSTEEKENKAAIKQVKLEIEALKDTILSLRQPKKEH